MKSFIDLLSNDYIKITFTAIIAAYTTSFFNNKFTKRYSTEKEIRSIISDITSLLYLIRMISFEHYESVVQSNYYEIRFKLEKENPNFYKEQEKESNTISRVKSENLYKQYSRLFKYISMFTQLRRMDSECREMVDEVVNYKTLTFEKETYLLLQSVDEAEKYKQNAIKEISDYCNKDLKKQFQTLISKLESLSK